MSSEPNRTGGRRLRCFTPRSISGGASFILFLAGCGACARQSSDVGGAAAKSSASAASAAVPVVVAPVIKKSMPLMLAGIGAVESTRTIAIKSFVTGTLLKVNFLEGQDVKKGDVLFEIDPRPFKNALHSAEADLEKTNAQLETADADAKRYGALVVDGMVSKQQYQSLENAAHSLRAARVGNLAAIDNAKLQLEYCSIQAPCDGRTGGLGAHEGDLVRASDPNNSLVTVTQLAPIYVTFALPQQDLPTLQHYQALGAINVVARPSAPDASDEKGVMSFLDSLVDAASGTIKLKASFANEQKRLWPGQFVRVVVTLANLPNQIVVPNTAVQAGQKGPQVFVVRADKTVELRGVVVDRSEGEETIISKGLTAGEIVVVDGQIRLRSNASVTIRPAVEDVASVRAPGPGRGPGAKPAASSPLGNSHSGAPAEPSSSSPVEGDR